jgi:hypothetical protein
VPMACGASEKRPTGTEHVAASSSAAPTPVRDTDTAHKLVIASAACWLGGLWSDAEGEEGAVERRAGTTRRCAEVVRALEGQDDPMKVEAVRVLDRATTDAIVAKVKELAAADGLDSAHAGALGTLAAAIVATSLETSAARRAATRIRADIEKLRTDKEKLAAHERDADRLSADEAASLSVLRAGSALDALVKLGSSGLPDEEWGAEAHAVGLMFALTRVRAGQDLPKHMKLYAVAPAYAAVFAVQPPLLPEHAKDKLKPGTWLAYLMQVAKACGHPPPDTVTTKREKEQLAWSGVLEGFAERLESDEARIKNPVLLEAVRGIAARLKPRSGT